jgi:hypothetical protein
LNNVQRTKEDHVPKRMKVAVVSLAGAFALALPATAGAISDEQACTDAGGTYTKAGGVASCAFPVGNSANVKTTSQKGSFGSSHDEALQNPGGNFPSGQQGGNTIE